MSDAEIYGPNDPGPRDARDANYAGSSGGRSGGSGGDGPSASGRAFPWERVAFTVIFAFFAWVAFWVALALALISGALRIFGQSSQENFTGYAQKVSDYLAKSLAYISGSTEEKPFPFG